MQSQVSVFWAWRCRAQVFIQGKALSRPRLVRTALAKRIRTEELVGSNTRIRIVEQRLSGCRAELVRLSSGGCSRAVTRRWRFKHIAPTQQ